MASSIIRQAIGGGFVIALVQLPALAEETGWLEMIEGYQGEVIGATMRRIETSRPDGTQRITVSIPKDSIKGDPRLEEVIVIGKRPDRNEPLSGFKHEWIKDYDKDNYGLIIKLSESTNYPIRLYFSADTDAHPKP